MIRFWPNPSAGEIHLFYSQILTNFVTVNDVINLRQGYTLALHWNLAKLLLPEYGQVDQAIVSMIMDNAKDGIAYIKGTNMVPARVATFDRAITASNNFDAGWILNGGFN